MRLWDSEGGGTGLRLHYVDVVRVLTREVYLGRGAELPPLEEETETKLLEHLSERMRWRGTKTVPKGTSRAADVMARRMLLGYVQRWRLNRAQRSTIALVRHHSGDRTRIHGSNGPVIEDMACERGCGDACIDLNSCEAGWQLPENGADFAMPDETWTVHAAPI